MDYVNFQGSVSDLLKIIFLEKKSRNKKFSMRAFARDIGVPPVFLKLSREKEI